VALRTVIEPQMPQAGASAGKGKRKRGEKKSKKVGK
jgi:hypothetical protein